MATIVFNVTEFRAAFPAFADPLKYPDALLQAYWDAATCFISSNDYGYLHGDCRHRAIDLMTAHLTQLGTQAANGQGTVGMTQSASVGEVSVSVAIPPYKTAFQYWLFSTPYGAQLAALLGVKAVGGFYISGLPEKTAFRRVGGLFSGR